MNANIDRVIEKALLTRVVEEKLLSLYQQGHIRGTVHTCIGQEFVGATLSEFLTVKDMVFSNHRGHGHFLSICGNPAGLISEILGNVEGVSRGLGGSQHLHQENFYSNGIQGGMTAVAVGTAVARRFEAATEKDASISVAFLGDGTLGEGLVYESFNIASKLTAPILFVVEDNEIAQSTPSELTTAGTLQGRAAAFDILYFQADTWDWKNLLLVAKNAISQVRTEQRPVILHVKTFRLKAHSKGDDTRSAEVISSFERRDPLNLLLSEATYQKRFQEIKLEIEAVADRCLQHSAQLPEIALEELSISWAEAEPDLKMHRQNLNEAFALWMRERSEVIFLGEDVLSPYGGAFKVAEKLSEEFPHRVLTMPISEAAIAGVATGLALSGNVPIAEIMFGDFMGLAFDQILNHAAKFQEMYNLKRPFKMVLRTPMGGYRGYGPTHSQSIEKHFLGIPGTTIVASSSLVSPRKIVDGLREGNGVFLLFENKALYGNSTGVSGLGYNLLLSSESFPTAWLKPQSKKADVTFFCYGGMTELVTEAVIQLFQQHDIIAQIIAPTKIYPFNLANLVDLIRSCPRFVVVEEGQGYAGFGAEIGAQLSEIFSGTKFQFRRCFAKPQIIPASAELERQVLPSLASIVQKALEMSYE